MKYYKPIGRTGSAKSAKPQYICKYCGKDHPSRWCIGAKFKQDKHRRAFGPPHQYHKHRCYAISEANSDQCNGGCERILFDSGANVCISNKMEDFDKEHFIMHKDEDKASTVSGLASDLKAKGYGLIHWQVKATNGSICRFSIPGVYIPDSKHCVMSTSVFLEHHPNETLKLTSNGFYLSGDVSDPAVSIPLNQDQLPFIELVRNVN